MSNVFVISSVSEVGADKDPRIGYKNQALIANTVTASHDSAGAAYTYDYMTTLKWQPANAAPTLQFDGAFTNVDYIGIAGVNWNSAGASVVIKDSGGNTLGNVSGLRDNQPAFVIITKASYSTIKFEFTASNTSLEVGEIYFGESMLLPRNVSTGYKPARWNFSDEISFSRTEQNHFGPSTVRNMGSVEQFQINFVDTSYMISDWEPFIAAAKGRPIFFLWNKNYQAQAVFGHWVASDPQFVTSLHSAINMTINGVA